MCCVEQVELKRLYSQLHMFKTKSIRINNPHIQKRGRTHRKNRKLSSNNNATRNKEMETTNPLKTPEESVGSVENNVPHGVPTGETVGGCIERTKAAKCWTPQWNTIRLLYLYTYKYDIHLYFSIILLFYISLIDLICSSRLFFFFFSPSRVFNTLSMKRMKQFTYILCIDR